MNLVLEMETSLEFWRRVYPVSRTPHNPVNLPKYDAAYRNEDVFGLAPRWLTPEFLAQTDGRIHALTFSHDERRSSSTHVAHIWSSPLPSKSFYQLDDVFVMSPEFVFLAAASMLELTKLIALGDELCGLYGFDKSAPRGFRKREVPLITKAQLDAYVVRGEGIRGGKRAAAALEHVVERSASPMETLVEMTMCLPYRMGGYGLPVPAMNYEIPLASHAAVIAKQDACYVDLYWSAINFAVEYLGLFDHSVADRMVSDRARTLALREMGLDVIELTKQQVNDLFVYERIVLSIAEKLGKRIKSRNLGKLPNRVALRQALFDWNASSGAVRNRARQGGGVLR